MLYDTYNFGPYPHKYISAIATTVVHTGRCQLVKIIIGETAAGAITIYDDTAANAGSEVGVLKSSIAEGEYEFNAECDIGLTIVTAAASKLTVIYKPLKNQ